MLRRENSQLIAHRRRTSPGARRAGQRERGAALVEFAIITPILFALLMGVVEFGITFNDSISLRQGVREGAREASVGQLDTCGADTSVNCTTQNRIGVTGVKVRVELPGGYAKGEAVLVCAQKELTSITGFYGPVLDGKFIRSKIQMRIEKAMTPAISEYTTESGDWAWCE